MIFGRELLIGVVIGFVLFWAYHKFAVPMGAPSAPLISYDKIGIPHDWKGAPFNSPGINPGR